MPAGVSDHERMTLPERLEVEILKQSWCDARLFLQWAAGIAAEVYDDCERGCSYVFADEGRIGRECHVLRESAEQEV